MHLSVLDLIYQRAGMVRPNPAVSEFRNGRWSDFEFEAIQRQAQHLSNYLIDSGIKSGDRIALLSESDSNCGVVFFAAVRAGAILVALDADGAVDDLRAQLLDSAPALVFASKRYVDLAAKIVNELKMGTGIICTQESPDLPYRTVSSVSTHILHEGCERNLEETALIAYTRGATAEPKGVMLTFSNLLFQADCLQRLFEVGKKDLFLSALPPASLIELTFGYLGILFAGGQVCYIPEASFKEKLRILPTLDVTHVVTHEPDLSLVVDVIRRRLARASMQRRLKFKMRFGLAKLLPRRSRRKLFPLVSEVVGSRFRSFISVGSVISADVESFLDTVGIDIYRGYGLTETGAVTTLNGADNFRLHSVGKPLPDVELRLLGSKGVGDAGEIVVRGPNIMRGYYKQGDKTSVAIDSSGWLYTGDLGVLDEDGYLFFRGRIKDLIHLADGSKFFPQEVEQVILQSALIKEICLLGLRDPNSFYHNKVVAVVVPEKNGVSKSAITKSINVLLANMPAFMIPAKVVLSTTSLPRTTSGEVKRHQVLTWLKSIESANQL